ncbi:excalibur calcium-binding domain-containing protein [Psychrobacter sp. ANT_H56B]|nr:excalibur calcium-binding domain-containing protein [Psychrobacter sp. ANT_H56B]
MKLNVDYQFISGRKHCSQITSCAEATYFIQHCPNTKMDGNNDGIPCEKQWCQ